MNQIEPFTVDQEESAERIRVDMEARVDGDEIDISITHDTSGGFMRISTFDAGRLRDWLNKVLEQP